MTHLAVPEDIEQQRQAFLHELRRIIIRAHLEEVLKQLVYHWVQSHFMGRRETVHPAMQRPANFQSPEFHCDIWEGSLNAHTI